MIDFGIKRIGTKEPSNGLSNLGWVVLHMFNKCHTIGGNNSKVCFMVQIIHRNLLEILPSWKNKDLNVIHILGNMIQELDTAYWRDIVIRLLSDYMVMIR